jgi:hypothetical protein
MAGQRQRDPATQSKTRNGADILRAVFVCSKIAVYRMP